MKNYIILSAIALASCTGNGNRNSEEPRHTNKDTTNATANNAPVQNRSYCFIRTDGTAQQDTTVVSFTVHAEMVEGEMDWIPEEKDSRRGVISGTISGDEITAMWRYMQEGMKDSMSVAFKLSPNQLAQKPLHVNATNGLQETNQAADYTVIYTPHDCEEPK